MRIVITDLTRFRPGNPKVCIAGVAEDGTVIRPMPYLSVDDCQRLGIHAGGILTGEFTIQNSPPPHVEDASYQNLVFNGACSKAEFKQALEATLYPSMAEGFGVPVPSREKCIPIDTPAVRSLVTIKINPRSFAIVRDIYNPERLKVHFLDGAGTELTFVSVTDREFYDYAQQHSDDQRAIRRIGRFIQSQKELYLRLGLSRAHQAPDRRHGYWVQVNGIYTFPQSLDYIRF